MEVNFKISQLAKDMGIKPKDIVEILQANKLEANTSKTLEQNEFDVFFNAFTRAHQIENIDDYLDGIVVIPVKKQEEPQKVATTKKEEAKPDTTEKAPATQTPHADKPQPEKAKEPVVPAKENATKPAVSVDHTNNSKPQGNTTSIGNRPQTQSPVGGVKPQGQSQTTGSKPMGQAPTGFAKQGGQNQNSNQRPGQSMNNSNTARPQGQSSFSGNIGANGQRSMGQNNAGGTRLQGQTPATGFRPNGQNQNNVQRPGQTPNTGNYTRPQGQSSFNGNTGFNGQRPAGQNTVGGARPAGFGQSPFGANNQGGFNKGGFGNGQQGGSARKPKSNNSSRDGVDNIPSGPRETFHATAIVREQTAKGTTTRHAAGQRVVDTRSSDVDLSKYDDRLYGFANEATNNARGGNQKIRKQPQSSKMENGRNAKNNGKKQAPVQQVLNITLPEEIVVSDLALRLKLTAANVVKQLMMMGFPATINQTIDYETAALVCEQVGAKYTKEVVVTIEEKLFDTEEDDSAHMVPRAPVICVMGHVDHGKTSILDAIRNTHVTSGEAGGITQHIGAYRVHVKDKDITFLDTPGHAAFTAMRARGAQATDIAILVVAADDGIMPQTVEAINHAKAAGIDIVVAINKMDKPTANPDAIKQELTKYDLVPEEWGGDVMCVPVSALTHQGIDDLLEAVLLVAEVKELKANPNRRAKGLVIESKLDKGRGPVATILVQNGTLHAGDVVIAGTSVGRVRAMMDHTGKLLKEAGPSVPVEITGLDEVPQAGDEFNAVEDERMARELANRRRSKAKEDEFKTNARANLNDLFAQISEGVKELNIIVKADVDGSAEAVKASLEKISNDEVKVRVIHSAVGGIRENDVMLATASNAIIVGFNVRPDKAALDSAERQGVDIRTYRIIYECIEEITAAMKGMLSPKFKETLQGHAEVRQTIHVPNVGTIAGSYIQDGKVTRASEIRVLRDGIVIFTDKIASLKRFKDDVREVAAGYECGIGLGRFDDIKIGDILEAYIMEEIEQ